MSRACQAQGYLAAILNRCFALSPIDALIGIKIGCGLRRQIPVRRDFDTITHLRTTVIPQRWPARRGYARCLGATGCGCGCGNWAPPQSVLPCAATPGSTSVGLPIRSRSEEPVLAISIGAISSRMTKERQKELALMIRAELENLEPYIEETAHP